MGAYRYPIGVQTVTAARARSGTQPLLDTNMLMRSMDALDVPAVRSLLTDLPRDYPNADAWLPRRLQDCLAGRARCTVAAIRDDVVGVTILTPKAIATKLSTIYVRPDFRRSGIGSRLLDHVLRDYETWVPGRARGDLYVTVAEHTWSQLEGLLSSRGFTRTAFERDRYGRGRHEIVATRLG